MADELPGLPSSSAINPVRRDLPRHDDPPARQKRRSPQRRPPPGEEPTEGTSSDDGVPKIGSRLNVRA